MKKDILLNIVFSIIYQLVYAVSGLIVPKLLLNTFGSKINGLVASLTSFLSLFMLFEGGMIAIVSAKLYKPLVENDNRGFNNVVAAGKQFYRKFAILYAGFAIIMAMLYPLFSGANYSFIFIFSLSIIIAATTFVSYYTYSILSAIVSSDGKSYIINLSLTIAAILNIIFIILAINTFPSIHLVKLISFVVYLINPLILWLYTKQHYKIIKNTIPPVGVLDQKYDGFAHQLCNFITCNADIYILTVFSNLMYVSVYSTYYAIIASLKFAINTLSSSLNSFLGKSFSSNNHVEEYFIFQLELLGLFTVIVFSCTYVLINSFISIYTSNISDIQYYNPLFAFLFTTSELLACLTFPYINIMYAKGDFKNTKYLSYTELSINLSLSLILVFKYNIIGVIIATIVSRFIRIIMQLAYLQKNEKCFKINKYIPKTIRFIIMIMLIVGVLNFFGLYNASTYTSWFLNGVLSLIISITFSLLFYLLFNRSLVIKIYRKFLDRKR